MNWAIAIPYIAATLLVALIAYSIGYDRGWDEHETFEDDRSEDV